MYKIVKVEKVVTEVPSSTLLLRATATLQRRKLRKEILNDHLDLAIKARLNTEKK